MNISNIKSKIQLKIRAIIGSNTWLKTFNIFPKSKDQLIGKNQRDQGTLQEVIVLKQRITFS